MVNALSKAAELETQPNNVWITSRDASWLLLLAAAVFAHGVAGLGGDGLAELGEYDGDGERRMGVSMNGAQ